MTNIQRCRNSKHPISVTSSAVNNFFPQLASKMEKLPVRIEKYQPEGGNFWWKKTKTNQQWHFRVTHNGKVYGSPVAQDDDGSPVAQDDDLQSSLSQCSHFLGHSIMASELNQKHPVLHNKLYL